MNVFQCFTTISFITLSVLLTSVCFICSSRSFWNDAANASESHGLERSN